MRYVISFHAQPTTGRTRARPEQIPPPGGAFDNRAGRVGVTRRKVGILNELDYAFMLPLLQPDIP